ncbi:DNA cytosine methyltransferase [Pseudomonas putida]|uniref:DNA cytosine methyltransferase n=1 Tax=Pseudomonas putida TaxID=303 RepID=UPI00235C304E|nr:DNA cytosine methyltransferase [Pseudomonas putida]GLO23522.1 DNA methyltransferase [Pseudomonas putida]HDS0969513.1 DNA cytosine methyltransferase [Pseudomonas putida]
MPTAIDLFAGLGGWSTGARAAGVQVLWAANHWPVAVEWHSANHPDTQHVCQDLHQARWEHVPAHDILLASPCCQGHAKARGKKSGNPEHDASRSTAWAPVSALEFHRPQAAVIENVPEFTDWVLYPAWLQAVHALGYQAAPHIVDCADLGVPQHRVRLFMVLTRSKAPLMLQLPQERHVPAASFLDYDSGRWSQIEKPGRAQATLDRVRNGRQRFGDRFIMPYYGKGSGTTGRDINRPIGTITTLDRWALVDADRMRMLSATEALAAMSFPADTLRPDNHRLTMHMAGNAVPPLAGQRVIEALLQAA